MWEVSITCLSITATLCAIGVLANVYDDNLGQRIAMGFIGVAAASRVASIWNTQLVDFDWMLLHIGLALFSLSTAYRCVRRFQRRSRRQFDAQRSIQ